MIDNFATYAKSSLYYPVAGNFPDATAVTVTAYLPDGTPVTLTSGAMAQVGTTGRWMWLTSNFQSQPADGAFIIIICTPDVGEAASYEILFGGPADAIYDIAAAIAALNNVSSEDVEAACEAGLADYGAAKTADVVVTVYESD